MATAISPHYTAEMFPNGMTLDEKIAIFEDRVRGWQLNQAESLLRNDPHSAFAAMHIALSYFESIAKFRHGHRGINKNGHSKRYFRLGFEWVFDDIKKKLPDKLVREAVLNRLYDKARSGLYHAGITGAGFAITANIPHVLEIQEDGWMVLNPHILVNTLNFHLSMYVRELRNPANIQLRKCFEYRFDWLSEEEPKDEESCENPSED
ncbi:MAG: hypothetical protein CL610_27535 [Anaerolineaceae bacterium]|nr:hypothetical protein [Anaerolineaceae bacterium]